jgi:acyl-CoA thioester hydrolase
MYRASDDALIAEGHFVHVFVDRETRRPVPIAEPMRTEMAKLVVE